MTVADDLATLHEAVESAVNRERWLGYPTSVERAECWVDALARVEAEIARLTENQMVRYERGDDFSHDFWKERAKAAEAEIARLRDGLRFYAEFDDDAIARRARFCLGHWGWEKPFRPYWRVDICVKCYAKREVNP